MRTRHTIAATAATLLATLTACSSSGKLANKPAPAATKPAPSPTPSPTEKPLTVGDTKSVKDSIGGSDFTVTVLAYTQPAKGPEAPSPELGGDVWATAEVKICNTRGNTFAVTQFTWSLAYDDGTRVEPTGLNGGDLPKPEYPTTETPVKEGRCVRGKIPYPVQSKSRPARIEYSPQAAEPVEWIVPAK
ncbi:DUF4352 domain-containing protein [Streptomyces sp. NPDC004111]|uniref:DUF4352 domain-containing protein n=1 Tax=Streptomyces sp. NPDC004111 TaxID=3364690 RepID=UPI0036AE14AE